MSSKKYLQILITTSIFVWKLRRTAIATNTIFFNAVCASGQTLDEARGTEKKRSI